MAGLSHGQRQLQDRGSSERPEHYPGIVPVALELGSEIGSILDYKAVTLPRASRAVDGDEGHGGIAASRGMLDQGPDDLARSADAAGYRHQREIVQVIGRRIGRDGVERGVDRR